MHPIYISEVCACIFLTLRKELKSAQIILASVLILTKTRNCPFGCGQKSANKPGKGLQPPPQTGNAHIHEALFKKGVPKKDKIELTKRVADG